MVIVVAIDVPLARNNGTAVAAMNLITSLRSKGHTVRILSPDKSLTGKPDAFVTAPINFGLFQNYVRENGVEISHSCRQTVRSALDGADRLHIITPFFMCAAALDEALSQNIPVTAGFHCQAENVTSHLFLMNSHGANHLTYKILWDKVYSRVCDIHYPTQMIRDIFEAEIGHTTNGHVISNGVNPVFVKNPCEKPPERDGEYVILFTGRYSKEKSHPVLIDTVSKSAHSDKIRLVFAGSGPREKYLKEYAKKLPLYPVFGFFKREELIKIINYSDLYVHPAEVEIEAIACLEAISCGLVPVIADSPRSATRYFAQDERNLFHFNNPDDLAAKIDYWLDNPGEKRKNAEKYAGFTTRFRQDFCMDRMEEMIVNAHITEKER